MPKELPLSRTRAGAPIKTASGRRSGPSAAQTSQPYPTRVSASLRSSKQDSQRQLPQNLLPQSPKDSAPEDVQNDTDHVDCKLIFKKADRDRAQLLVQLNEQRQEASKAAGHFGAEKARFQAQNRKLHLDLQKAKEEVQKVKQERVDLQKRFEESTPDPEAYVLRVDYEQILTEFGMLSSSMTRKIEKMRSDSENVSITKFMPHSDALQSPWAPDEFDVLGNPAIPEDMAPMLSTSEALALPNFDTYGETS
ncbi:hypothetical protein N7448_011164 [Penicillium atrosanguineum]|uniref:Uncharacterized protein n=1 Tax=Penicillium atrosanguineum TaxID=1132637 RepID=A0A9W9KTC3_9EURO|nr:hypothetical protein N7448_011134 [Penicillium atrosanguineum]KAJ5117532.1 hypothetical protein N7448_011164 [Penicillium atrosanguineum]KAJ5318293.1 hypothetical protein N7476_004713 [Penicillium atrosanguineum]